MQIVYSYIMGIENHFLAGKYSPFKQMNQKNVVNDEIPPTSEPSEGWMPSNCCSPCQRLEMMIKTATSCWKREYLIFKWTDLYLSWINYPKIFLLKDIFWILNKWLLEEKLFVKLFNWTSLVKYRNVENHLSNLPDFDRFVI